MTAEIEGFIRQAATARGIDPDTAVRVARSEGGVDEYAKRGTFSTGSSWWPFQQHYGGAGYEQYGNVAGQGNGFTALTGWQPGDPAAWKDSVRYALNRAKRDGWGAWYGAAAAGIGRWDGIDRSHPWDANTETWDYERKGEPVPAKPMLRTTSDLNLRDKPTAEGSTVLEMVPQGSLVEPLDTRAWRRVRHNGRDGWMAADYLEDAPAGPVATSIKYDQNFPLRLQFEDYSCSIRTTQMMLESVGILVDIGTLHGQMVPEYVSEEVGLLDGSGAGIVQMMRIHYGVVAQNFSPATWDGVVDVAGKLPVGLGGHGWGGVGHWVAVRYVKSDTLVLANPGGTGPVFGQQFLDRQRWDSIAHAWSAVVITGRA